MSPYVLGGAACACVVLNLIIGLLIGTVSDRWNCSK
jgi:hypothetical protein